MITVDTNPPPACKRTKTASKWQQCVLGATFMRRHHRSLYFCNDDKYVLDMSCYGLWLTHRGGRPQSPRVSLRYHIHHHSSGACSDLWLPKWVFHVWAQVDFCATRTLTYDLPIMSPLIEILSKLLDENSDGKPNSELQSKWEQAGRWRVVTGTIKSDAQVQVSTSEPDQSSTWSLLPGNLHVSYSAAASEHIKGPDRTTFATHHRNQEKRKNRASKCSSISSFDGLLVTLNIKLPERVDQHFYWSTSTVPLLTSELTSLPQQGMERGDRASL